MVTWPLKIRKKSVIYMYTITCTFILLQAPLDISESALTWHEFASIHAPLEAQENKNVHWSLDAIELDTMRRES